MQVKGMSERQLQIVEASMRILASEGPRCFTAQRLADEIGVTPGAIYRHFESMESIVDAIVDQMGAMLFDYSPPEAADPIERLRFFFQRRARVILGNPHLSRLLLTDHLAQAAGPAHAARVEEFKRRSQRFVVDCLRQAAKSGLLAKGLRPEAGAVIVLGAVLSLSHAGTRIAKASGTEQLSLEVWAAIEGLLRRHDRRSMKKPSLP
jgi:AcrR family transcriptional regulator